MLLNLDYDTIYSVEIQGIGFSQKVKSNANIIKISPSRFLGSTLNVNQSKINENIKLGYYDTLKVLKKYDGYNYIFKNYSNKIYNILTNKSNKDLYIKCKKYFHAYTNKELILKCLEYIMTKESITYFHVYNLFKQINYVKKYTNNNHFVYEFIRSL